MPITRQFRDWSQPALPAAAADLLAMTAAQDVADLTAWTIVVPGARSGRRLLELLAEQADKQGRVLLPPLICTPGALPETLYQPQRPFATPVTQRLAWVSALQQMPTELLSELVAAPPAKATLDAWLELADLIRHQHRELAADAHNFADLVQATQQLGQARESERWRVLRQVQRRYLELLDEAGLWDRQTARLEAIARRECATEKRILLLAVVDLNLAMRRMLDQVAEQVTAWIVAPSEFTPRFDAYGCLDTSAWQEWQTELPLEGLRIADTPEDQATQVVDALSDWGDRYSIAQVAIGLCDERMVSQVQRRLDQHGVASRWGPGTPLQDSSPARLLDAIASFLVRSSYRDLAALVRHADLVDWLATLGHDASWLIELDKFYERQLPDQIINLAETFGRSPKTLSGPMCDLQDLLQKLQETDQPFDQWRPHLAEILLTIYGSATLQPEDNVGPAAVKLLEHLEAFVSVPPKLQQLIPASTAIRMWLQEATGAMLPAPEDDQAIELLGWLELPLDTADAVVVTSLNEGFVPKSVTSDLFLPDSLRQSLGLEDNRRRFARDAYALATLLASHSDVAIIVGRRDVERHPLKPSRLLFGGTSEEQARLALQLFGPLPPAQPTPTRPKALSRHHFVVPRPDRAEETIQALRVTQFRDYLACPYRFYLQHVRQLQAMDDASTEMQATAFGDLMHEVLKRFAAHEQRNAESPEIIQQILRSELDRCVTRRFRQSRLPTVALQVEQLWWRLQKFAELQAERARAGWQIRFFEAGPDANAPFPVDGQPFGLRGRIDRIDWNPITQEWVLWDYKSSDTPSTPEDAHRKQGRWVDLQLPLYRHLARAMKIEGELRLGYIVLPKAIDRTAFLATEWTAEDLATADATAQQVVRDLRSKVFWPPADPPPQFGAEWSSICQDRVLDREAHRP